MPSGAAVTDTHDKNKENSDDKDSDAAHIVATTPRREMTSLEAIGTHAPVALHTIASQLASATSTCVFYPLDVLRTRFVAQDGTQHRAHNGHTYTSVPRALRAMVRDEGVRALFRGCSVAVAGATAAWGLYMFCYRELCNWSGLTSYFGRSGVSLLASMASAVVMSPVFMLKSRMQLEEVAMAAYTRSRGATAAATAAAAVACSSNSSSRVAVAGATTAASLPTQQQQQQQQSPQRPYGRFSRGLVHAVRSGGVRSLWCGASLQLLLVFPNALSLPTYDYLKSRLLSRHTHVHVLPHHHGHTLHEQMHQTSSAAATTTSTAHAVRDLTLSEVCVCATLTRLLVVTLSHPLMMTRVRMQDHRCATAPLQYRRVLQSLSLTLKTQGVRGGLYRGFSTSLLHSFPRALMHYVLYEKTLSYLCHYRS